ncbi:glycoside hydrolase family 16 protein [Altererythrobacter sp. ZODW24]|uniref:glycoside hydrolase family 16 protein n=1 Tax=Altererythrobacter sp. ZODW24 TaxID=2185142 RepID=UPI000DF791D4|nr:glycoside hydrolase family 16 protein [Altererythrobacter sp. ZODW24]
MSFSKHVRIAATLSGALLLAACEQPQVEPVADSAGGGDGWQLVWSDEFSGEVIDRAKWGFDENCWGGGNEERQCYTSDQSNASVEGGRLIITALKQEATGSALPAHMRKTAADHEATATKPFTSARMTTRGKAAWKYGRIEVRAKFPQGQGTWPAIWMLPEDDVYGGWAASGEIDILETVNLGVPCEKCPGGREDTILGTLHFGGFWPDNLLASTEISFPKVLDGFHTYGVVWSEGRFDWTVDGKVYATKVAKDWSTVSSDDPNAPFDQQFHLILNLAIGGKLPEERGLGGVSGEGFPKQMEVDWVRVWQCADDAASICSVSGDE